jgi:hypothetical protein
MTRSPSENLDRWIVRHEQSLRILLAESVTAIGRASEALALVTTRSHERSEEDLKDAVEAETQLTYLLTPTIQELRRLTRRLVRAIEQDQSNESGS